MSTKTEYEEKLRQLVQYIEQDGYEKAEEVDVKAEEEYYMEKKNYITNRVGAVQKYYDNLEKKFQQQIILDISKIKGQSYRDILQARDLVVEDVYKSVRERFSNLDHSNNKCVYKKVLFQLTLQGLVQMMEPTVILQVRQNDRSTITSVLKQVQKVFFNLTGMNVVLSVDDNIPNAGSGGVKMYTSSKSVSVNNTLDTKLDQMSNKLLPHIRTTLFGRNPNRKHDD